MEGFTKRCRHSDTTESSFCLPNLYTKQHLLQLNPVGELMEWGCVGAGLKFLFCIITFLCPRIFRSVHILLQPPIPTGKQILSWFLYPFLSSVLYPNTLSPIEFGVQKFKGNFLLNICLKFCIFTHTLTPGQIFHRSRHQKGFVERSLQ